MTLLDASGNPFTPSQAELYRHLNYPGDIADSFNRDDMLGWDPMGFPYRVVDAFYADEIDKTTVVLTKASADDVRRWFPDSVPQ